MRSEKKLRVLACGILLLAVAVGALFAQEGGGRANNIPPVSVYVPYPYQNNYPNDTYYQRLLEQYQRDTGQRLLQLEQDVSAVGQDIKVVIAENKKEKADTDQIARRLDAIERTLSNINGRMKNLEQTVAMQNVRIKKLSNKITADVNVPDPNVTTDPNAPRK